MGSVGVPPGGRHVGDLAICTGRSDPCVALAACAFALPALTGDDIITVQVTPAGRFAPSDGRPMKVPYWHIDHAIASRVIERFAARKTPPVLDYEHQTLHKEANGQPAPAAGWFRSLAWREGQGLFAEIELTARAKDAVAAREYLYFSPVFAFDPATGEVLSLQMGALTNAPAIDGMEPLALRAAATFGLSTTDKGNTMKNLLAAVAAALALSASVTEDEAIAALSQISPKLDELGKLRKALGIDDAIAGDAAVAACASTLNKAATPDPAKFVPVSVVDGMKTEIAALTERVAKHDDAALTTLVDQALGDGRLLPAQKDWAVSLGRSDLASLTTYLAAAKPLPALAGSQTRGQRPQVDDIDPETQLSKDELAVCSATGVDPKDFLAHKASA